MPLSKGTSQKTVEHNFQKLLAEGRKPDQAYAIAKSVQRSNRRKPSERVGISKD